MSVTAGFDNHGKLPVVAKPQAESKAEEKTPAKKPVTKKPATKTVKQDK